MELALGFCRTWTSAWGVLSSSGHGHHSLFLQAMDTTVSPTFCLFVFWSDPFNPILFTAWEAFLLLLNSSLRWSRKPLQTVLFFLILCWYGSSPDYRKQLIFVYQSSLFLWMPETILHTRFLFPPLFFFSHGFLLKFLFNACLCVCMCVVCAHIYLCPKKLKYSIKCHPPPQQHHPPPLRQASP